MLFCLESISSKTNLNNNLHNLNKLDNHLCKHQSPNSHNLERATLMVIPTNQQKANAQQCIQRQKKKSLHNMYICIDTNA